MYILRCDVDCCRHFEIFVYCVTFAAVPCPIIVLCPKIAVCFSPYDDCYWLNTNDTNFVAVSVMSIKTIITEYLYRFNCYTVFHTYFFLLIFLQVLPISLYSQKLVLIKLSKCTECPEKRSLMTMM